MYRQSKKTVKQQYPLHMFSQYGKLPPITGWDCFTSLVDLSKFQRVSRLAFVTAATSLTRGQPNFARFWPSPGLVHDIYIFGGSCPLTEFFLVQNSLYVEVLHSLILAALLQGTPASAVSQTFWRGTRNGITEPSQRAPPMFGWAAITLGIGPHSSLHLFCLNWLHAWIYMECLKTVGHIILWN